MPHLRDDGCETGWGDDDVPNAGARACLGGDRDDGRCREEASARDEACAAVMRTPGTSHADD